MKKKTRKYLLSMMTLVKFIFTDLFFIVQGVGELPGPQTGDDAPTLIIFLIMGIAVAVMVALLVTYLLTKKKSEKNTDKEKGGNN